MKIRIRESQLLVINEHHHHNRSQQKDVETMFMDYPPLERKFHLYSYKEMNSGDAKKWSKWAVLINKAQLIKNSSNPNLFQELMLRITSGEDPTRVYLDVLQKVVPNNPKDQERLDKSIDEIMDYLQSQDFEDYHAFTAE